MISESSKGYVHLDGGAVGHDAALDIETLAAVTVGVELVRASRGRRRVRGTRASGAEESLLDALVEAAVAYRTSHPCQSSTI